MSKRTRQERFQLAVFGIGGAVAIVLLGMGIYSTNEDAVDDEARTRTIEQLVPERFATVPLQNPVGIELEGSRLYQVQLCVDGVPIPSDEYTAGDTGLGQFIFKPGGKSSIREWTQGPHDVLAGYWPNEIPIEEVWPDSATCQPPIGGGVEFVQWSFTAG